MLSCHSLVLFRGIPLKCRNGRDLLVYASAVDFLLPQYDFDDTARCDWRWCMLGVLQLLLVFCHQSGSVKREINEHAFAVG